MKHNCHNHPASCSTHTHYGPHRPGSTLLLTALWFALIAVGCTPAPTPELEISQRDGLVELEVFINNADPSVEYKEISMGPYKAPFGTVSPSATIVVPGSHFGMGRHDVEVTIKSSAGSSVVKGAVSIADKPDPALFLVQGCHQDNSETNKSIELTDHTGGLLHCTIQGEDKPHLMLQLLTDPTNKVTVGDQTLKDGRKLEFSHKLALGKLQGSIELESLFNDTLGQYVVTVPVEVTSKSGERKVYPLKLKSSNEPQVNRSLGQVADVLKAAQGHNALAFNDGKADGKTLLFEGTTPIVLGAQGTLAQVDFVAYVDKRKTRRGKNCGAYAMRDFLTGVKTDKTEGVLQSIQDWEVVIQDAATGKEVARQTFPSAKQGCPEDDPKDRWGTHALALKDANPHVVDGPDRGKLKAWLEGHLK